jgi:hypothetical protein
MVGAGLIRVYIEWGLHPVAAFAASLLTVLAVAFGISMYLEPLVRQWLRAIVEFGEGWVVRIPFLGFVSRPGGAIT